MQLNPSVLGPKWSFVPKTEATSPSLHLPDVQCLRAHLEVIHTGFCSHTLTPASTLVSTTLESHVVFL